MNDEIPDSTGVDAVDRILSNKYRKSADVNSTFSKQVRDTGNLALRKERSETVQKISPSKAKSPWLSKMPSKQVDDDEMGNGTISNTEKFDDYIPKLSSDGFRASSPSAEEDIKLVSDGFKVSTEKSKPSKKKSLSKKSSDKTWNERWKEDNWATDKAFDTLAEGASALGKMTK